MGSGISFKNNRNLSIAGGAYSVPIGLLISPGLG